MHRIPVPAFATALAVALALALTGCSAPGYDSTGSDTGSAPVQDTAPAPTATPTPVISPAPDESTVAPTSMQTTLVADGYSAVLVDASGAPVADPTGWTFVRESPLAGTPIAAGSTVTITLAPPAPVVVAPAPAPAAGGGATALCRDGSLSYSAHRSGTCSHHGGVAQWY
jgi:hypothetical protein